VTVQVHIRDCKGERIHPDATGPWSLGGADADVVLKDDLNSVYAHIGFADGQFFVQAAANGAECLHNGLRFTESVWLQDGDRISLAGHRLHCACKGETLSVRLAGLDDGDQAVLPPRRHPQPKLAPERVKRVHPWVRRLTIFGAIVLSIGALFVLLAQPLILRITPQPDHFSVSGFPPAVAVGGRYLALPGHYRVHAELQRYSPLNTSIVVQRAGPTEFPLQMQKLPGRITVKTEPVDGVQVAVDGKQVGTTPMPVFKVAAGLHQFRFSAPRYLATEQELQVEGLDKAQTISIQLAPGWGSVSITSSPEGASIHVDGKELGTTPATLEIMAGEHDVALSLTGYVTASNKLQISAGESLQLPEITLREPPGHVQLNTRPRGATVTLDGEYLGRSPLTVSLTPRKVHHLKLELPGHKTMTRKISLPPGQTRAIDLEMEAEYGTVFVTSDPADAKLFIDGKPHGAATQRLRLTARNHKLRVEKPGYVDFSATVLPRPGISKQIVARLKSLARVKAESIREVIKTAAGQRLRLVHPGVFDMGASRRDPGRRANETLHRVRLTKAYYLSENLVTNAQYRQFDGKHLSGPGLNGPKRPVTKVDWDDAVRYLNWLSSKDGLSPAYVSKAGKMVPVIPHTTGYRLPTEAEWAYAARKAGRSKVVRFSWGTQFPPPANSGNFADASAGNVLPAVLDSYNDHFATTSPVAHFKANPAGFFDFAGNSAEWCQDYYAIFPFVAGKEIMDPLGPATGKHHVVRGSSWRSSTITQLRLSFRDYRKESADDIGFRVARYVE